jgi:hypothetical protein
MARRTAKVLEVYCALFFCTLNSPLLMLAIASQAPPKIVSFPSQSQAVSPNARYVVIGEENHAEPFHTAILEDRVLRTRRKLFDYDRHVDLLWNPDSKSFAVTDYEESDYSRCSIMFTDRTVPTIRIWDKLVKTLTDRERKSLLENHHVYIAAVEWIGAGALKVKVWGYGEVNPSGFTRFYSYDSDGSVKPLNN